MQQIRHAEDAVQRRADFVGHHRKESALRQVGGIGLIACLGKFAFHQRPGSDIAADALNVRGRFGVAAH